MLVQHVTVQGGSKGAAGQDLRRQGSQPGVAVGVLPGFAARACDARFPQQFLNDVVLLALEGGTDRWLGERNDDLAVEGALRVFGAFVGSGAFVSGRGRLAWRFQG